MTWGIMFRFACVACRRTLLSLGLAAAAASAQGSGLFQLDSFADMTSWRALATNGVTAMVQAARDEDDQALRLEYDFHGRSGYALAHRALPLDFDGDYEISFDVRADPGAPLNDFQFKLIDASGDNVWWANRPDFALTQVWRHVVFKKRHITFAWGPTADRVLKHSESLEFVVSAGRDGGHGAVYVRRLTLRKLETQALPAAVASATSALPGYGPSGILDEPGRAWRSDPAEGNEQQLTIDFGRPKEFGGLILHWEEGVHASRYDIAFSDDGEHWRVVRSVRDGRGGANPILLTESETRLVQVRMHAGPRRGYGLRHVEVKGLAFGQSANAFFEALAADRTQAPRGAYPRGLSGEQDYWTVLGVDGGSETGLLSEDGALEVARGGFTVEPFVVEEGHGNSELVTWADVRAEQSLRDGYLPIPSVTWHRPQWTLRTTAFAQGDAAQARLLARYELVNTSAKPQSLRLVLALRPFQVNPPTQFLNTPPGVSRIERIDWNGSAFEVDGQPRVLPLSKPALTGVSSFDAERIPQLVAGEGWTAQQHVEDGFGFASGALAYDVQLAPHARAVFGLVIPLIGSVRAVAMQADPAAWLQTAEDDVARDWRKKLDRITLKLPRAEQRIADTLRSSLAHILMTRNGPMLRPGTRSYARSWIRDGAMMSEGLLRLGQNQVARDYLQWYSPYQFDDGMVPCCVDRRGSDPVPENDSQGEFIFLAAQIWRYSDNPHRDFALLQAAWPRVRAAAAYMEAQRQSERSDANLAAERRALYGLLPASISHEGYSAKPMHSYWDDFWGLRGYRDAKAIAIALGKQDDASRLGWQGDAFQADLLASLQAAVVAHGIDYLPGAAELGDFDPTSTTIALSPGGLLPDLPQKPLYDGFERYWSEFEARRDGQRAWSDYTPYELRNVSAFVRFGWRERAQALLDFFFADRRPAAWNQWAEVVGRDARAPRFVEDMPHGWISSDYIRAALDLFAYERQSDHALVLAAGVPLAWLDGDGIAVRGLRTPYGVLTYTLRRRSGRIELTVLPSLVAPSGGLVLTAWSGDASPVFVNGKQAAWRNGELRIDVLQGVDGGIKARPKVHSNNDTAAAVARRQTIY